MEQLLIKTPSQKAALAIKKFASKFDNTIIDDTLPQVDGNYFINTYGMDNVNFETRLNKGIAESILGLTKPWEQVKVELVKKIIRS